MKKSKIFIELAGILRGYQYKKQRLKKCITVKIDLFIKPVYSVVFKAL